MNLNTRLRQLEARTLTPPDGCLQCRDWPSTLVTWRDGPAFDPYPAICPHCRRERRVSVLERSEEGPEYERRTVEAWRAVEAHPLQEPPDLSKLTDEQLDDLERLAQRLAGERAG
jgi:hypothetical protein